MSTPAPRFHSAIVTGAASGIGRATANRLAEKGLGICLVDRDEMDSVETELSDRGVPVTSIRGDIADPAVMNQAAGAATAMGQLAVAVLNAGVMSGESDLAKVDFDRYHKVVGTNITGVVNGLRAVISASDSHPVSVVVTSSSVGLVPAPHDPVYAMTKHAVVGLVRSIALNPKYQHIRFNCICPNGVDTPLIGSGFKSGRQLLSPDDVALRIVEVAESDGTGQAWVCTPTTFERFTFPENPGYTFPAFDPS